MTSTSEQTHFSWKKLLLPGLACAGLLAWVYAPTFEWMVDRWSVRDSYYGHGFLIPLVSLFWIWQKRAEIAKAVPESSAWGFPVLAAAAVLQIFAAVFRVYFISAFSFVFMLFAGVLLLGGLRLLKLVWFPVFFLTLMVPLPLLMISEITLKMKFLVTEMAVHCLNAVGLHSERQGSYIVLPNTFLLVGDPCSGLRSFLSFLCLGFVFAYGGRTAWWGKLVLVFAGLPLAILSNLMRVFFLGLVAEVYGQEAAGGKIHDVSGIVVFIISFCIFMVIRQKLEGSHAG